MTRNASPAHQQLGSHSAEVMTPHIAKQDVAPGVETYTQNANPAWSAGAKPGSDGDRKQSILINRHTIPTHRQRDIRLLANHNQLMVVRSLVMNREVNHTGAYLLGRRRQVEVALGHS
jgi:hypothetical protein